MDPAARLTPAAAWQRSFASLGSKQRRGLILLLTGLPGQARRPDRPARLRGRRQTPPSSATGASTCGARLRSPGRTRLNDPCAGSCHQYQPPGPLVSSSHAWSCPLTTASTSARPSPVTSPVRIVDHSLAGGALVGESFSAVRTGSERSHLVPSSIRGDAYLTDDAALPAIGSELQPLNGAAATPVSISPWAAGGAGVGIAGSLASVLLSENPAVGAGLSVASYLIGMISSGTPALQAPPFFGNLRGLAVAVRHRCLAVAEGDRDRKDGRAPGLGSDPACHRAQSTRTAVEQG